MYTVNHKGQLTETNQIITRPIEDYRLIKKKHQDAIVVMLIDNYYWTFEQDAYFIALVANFPLHTFYKGREILNLKFHEDCLDQVLATLCNKGKKVAVCMPQND